MYAIAQPPAEWKSSLELFQQVLEHEQKVTGMIHQLYELALAEKDFPTQVMLQWFIKEQVEEESTAAKIVFKLTQIKDSVNGMWILDKQLGARGTGA